MAAARFMRKGITRFFWNGTVVTTPTVANVNGYSRLDSQLTAVNGFNFASQFIDAPIMSSSFTPKEVGEDQVADSSLEFFELRGGTDTVKGYFTKGATGMILILPDGGTGTGGVAAVTDVVDIWPCTIGSISRQYSAGNELARYIVSFACTAQPTLDYALAS